jgi:hypothetical protein
MSSLSDALNAKPCGVVQAGTAALRGSKVFVNRLPALDEGP